MRLSKMKAHPRLAKELARHSDNSRHEIKRNHMARITEN